ncbi:YutD family protein [Paenibacillus sp. TRM 82003]|nr:YutD family protein [Paenibacillus sp. TRM 82003]
MIWVGGKAYELLQAHKDAWKPDAFKERYSEVLDRYDYIVGDWGYNQLRLKGFFKEGSNRATKDSAIGSLQDYLQEYCNFGCAYFILERVPGKAGSSDGAGEEDTLAASVSGAEAEPVAVVGTDDASAEGGTDEAKMAEEGPVVQQTTATGIPGIAGGMAFSDRKPYSWREHQSPARSARNAERAAAAAERAEAAAARAEGGGRPEGRQDGRGGRYGGDRERGGKPRFGQEDGRGGRPNRGGGGGEYRGGGQSDRGSQGDRGDRSYGSGGGPSGGSSGAPNDRNGGGQRPQGGDGSRKFHKGPRQSGPNKHRGGGGGAREGGGRPEGGPREGGGRAPQAAAGQGGNRERTQQRHHHKPQPNQQQ